MSKKGNHKTTVLEYSSIVRIVVSIIEQWFNQVKHYIKLDKPSTFIKLKESLTSSILKIKIDNYKNYFIYAYNKEIYKKNSKKSSKYKKPKIYKK